MRFFWKKSKEPQKQDPALPRQEEPSAQVRPLAAGDLVDGRFLVEAAEDMPLFRSCLVRPLGVTARMRLLQPLPASWAEPTFRAGFSTAARSWIGLALHPQICSAFYLKNINGVPCIFAEPSDGGSLRQMLDRNRVPDTRIALTLALEIGLAMQYAHDKGVAHGGLGPETVFLSSRRSARVGDFGLALLSDPSPAAPGPLPPEWKSGIRRDNLFEQNRSADLFLFGSLLAEMLLGKKPQPSGAPPADPRAPEKLLNLAWSCMNPDPARRPPDFREIGKTLASAYSELFSGEPACLAARPPDMRSDAYNNQACALFEAGDRAGARTHLDRALSLSQTNPYAVYNMGLLDWEAGEADDENLRSRLSPLTADPQNRGIIEELVARLDLLRGDPEGARHALRMFPEREKDIFTGITINPVSLLRVLREHQRAVICASITPDGRFAVSGDEGGEVCFFRLDTGECLGRVSGHEGTVNTAAMAANGRIAITGGTDRSIAVWDVASRKLLARLSGHVQPVTSLAVSSDGRFAVSGANDMTVRHWDLLSRECINKFSDQALRVNNVAMTPDGHFAAAVSMDNFIHVYGLGSGKHLNAFQAGRDTLTTCALSKDGQFLLAGDMAGGVSVYDLSARQLKATRKLHKARITSVCLSATGQHACSASTDGRIKLWDVEKLRCVRTLSLRTGFARSLSMTADASILASAGPGSAITVYQLAFRQDFSATPAPSTIARHEHKALTQCMHGQKVEQARVLANRGHYRLAYDLILGSLRIAKGEEDQTLLAFLAELVEAGRLVKPSSEPEALALKGHQDRAKDAALCDGGTCAVTVAYDRTSRVWDLSSGKMLRVLRGHRDGITSVSASPDGQTLLTGSLDRTMLLYFGRASQPALSFGPEPSPITAVALLEKTALSGSDRGITVYDLKTGKAQGTLEGQRVFSIALSSDRKTGLWRIPGNQAACFDLATNTRKSVMSGHREEILSLAITRAGRFGATGDRSGLVKYWHIPTSRPLADLSAHKGPATALCFTPCGSLLFTGGEDGAIKIWDLTTKQTIHEFVAAGKGPAVQALTLAPSGRHLVACLADGNVTLFKILWEMDFPSPKGRTSAFGRV
ncbi:MAG: protein kinase [Thermodesulfobacteriota bacterium]